MRETKAASIDLIDEALKQAMSCPKTMVKFIQVAIPCLNVHSEGGTCDAENHTNGGRYLLSLSSEFVFHISLNYFPALNPCNSKVLNPVNKPKG